jgi:serine protease Do
VDEKVKVKIFRKGKVREVKVRVGRLDDGQEPLASGPDKSEGVLGLSVANLTPELAERYSVKESRGILVTAIDPDGSAAEANLRIGDQILDRSGCRQARQRQGGAAVDPAPGDPVLHDGGKRLKSLSPR